MAPTEMLKLEARRAYEIGRVRAALRVAPIVLLAAAAAALCGRPLGLTCALGALVLSLAVGLGWRGGAGGRAVPAGILAGIAAFALPIAVQTIGHLCLGDACMVLCQPACVVGGALAGALIALRAARESEGELLFVAAAITLAGLLGALGCTLAGASGVLGMIAGAVGAGTPVLVHAHARR